LLLLRNLLLLLLLVCFSWRGQPFQMLLPIRIVCRHTHTLLCLLLLVCRHCVIPWIRPHRLLLIMLLLNHRPCCC
jgi:hypothetical protein